MKSDGRLGWPLVGPRAGSDPKLWEKNKGHIQSLSHLVV